MLATENKAGALFVYARDHISAGPAQRIQMSDPHDFSFIGLPAYDPVTRALFVANTSDEGQFRHGMVAMGVQPSCSLKPVWQQVRGADNSPTSPPTVANGVVYWGDGSGNQAFAFDAATGQELWNSGATIAGPVQAAPIVANGRLYVFAWDNTVHAFGL